MSEMGAVLREARKQRGLSQQELGHQLGMSRATISAIENGTVVEVGIRKVMALCASLGLEMIVQEKRAYPTLQTLRLEAHDKKRR